MWSLPESHFLKQPNTLILFKTLREELSKSIFVHQLSGILNIFY